MALLKSACLQILLVCLLTMTYLPHETDGATQAELYNLMDTLFTSYKSEVRPTTAGEATTVDVALFLLSIAVNEKSQVFEATVIIDLEWLDDYLSWDPSAHGNVQYFLYPQEELWLPDIIVENSVKSQSQLGYDENVLKIYSNGTVKWRPSQVLETSCSIDITYYPFDTQSCDIILSTWFSIKDDIDIDPETGTSIRLDYYSQSGTWSLESTKVAELPNLADTTRIGFTMKISRLRAFYIMNIILPVIFLSFTSTMVFLLPAEAGEKMGMSITVLLAYTVYLTIISENMPQTSLQISIMAVYLTINLACTAIGVILSTVVLLFHHKPDECKIGKKTERLTRYVRKILKLSNNPKKDEDCDTMKDAEGKQPEGISNERPPLHTIGSRSKSNCVSPFNDKLKDFTKISWKNDSEEEEITWPKVAHALDRVCFIIISLIMALSAIILFPVLFIGGSS